MSAKKQSRAKQKQTPTQEKLSRCESVEVARSGGESASGEALPEGWAWAKLGEVSQFINGDRGTNYPNKSALVPEGIPFINAGHIEDEGRIDLGSMNFVTRERYNLLGGGKVQKGDILYCLRGSLGKTAVVRTMDEGAIASSLVIIRPADLANVAYLYSFLVSPLGRDRIAEYDNGTAQPNLSAKSVRDYSVPFPPRAEQSRIVSAIESLQERSSRARVLLSEVGPLIGQLRQSVLRDAFSGKLTADWREANPDVEPASELLSRIRTERRERWDAEQLAKYEAKGKHPPKNWQDKYKEPEPVDESELPELPDGWCWEALEAMVPAEFPVVYGIIQAGPNIPDGVPYIRPADINDSAIDFDKLLRTTPEIAAKYERAALKPGDLIFSVVGTIGKTLIADDRLDGANITQSSVRIRMFKPFNARMILRVLQSPLVEKQMDLLQFGNAVQRLNVEHMRRLAIPVPPLKEWQRISELVEQGFNSLAKVEAEVASMESSLTQLDQSILSKAFRGELVPQDPRDEPASELLARIRATREASSAKTTSKKKRATTAKAVSNA
jgi:type I restriction enzyme S subunit